MFVVADKISVLLFLLI